MSIDLYGLMEKAFSTPLNLKHNTYKRSQTDNFMTDTRVERLADLAVNYSAGVKKNQEVFIAGPVISLPLIEEIYKHVLYAGAYPTVIFREQQLDDIKFLYAQDHQLEHVPPVLKFIVQKADRLIRIKAERNPKHLASIDPKKIAKNAATQREITEIMADRIKKGEFNWTLYPFPTDSMAQEASMSFLEYQDFVFKTCFAHTKDPVKEWQKASEMQEKIVTYLNKRSEFHIIGEDTDLTFCAEGRKWINSDGKKNMPDGEVFTGPVEDSVEGEIRFTFPALYRGNEVEDVNLHFKKGVAVKAEAERGEAFLNHMIGIDEGSSKVGEIAIGTNYQVTRFTKDMLFDEKMGGTIHMALGRGLPETGSDNRSAIHWDILKDMRKSGKIYADDELFYENGKFLI